MHLSYNLLFVQVFGFLPLTVNATFGPSSLSAISDVAPSTKLNVSTFLNATTRCVLPVPPVIPVSLKACESALRWLLSVPDVDYIRPYRHNVNAVMITYALGCFVGLDRARKGGEIALSKRMIVGYAERVLVLCQNFGQGGWAHIDGNDEWIVVVSGDPPGVESGIGSAGLSLESRAR